MTQLFLGDCLQLLQDIPAGSVDCVIADLPYGTTQCKWDSVIPLPPLWEQFRRIIKRNGTVLLFGQEPFSSFVRISNINQFKYDWVWRKPRGTGHLNANRQPLRDVETISVFYDGQCTYNPQFTKGSPYTALKGGKQSWVSEKAVTVYGRFMNGAQYRNDNSGFRYPKQVLEFGVVERNTLHPTQKPVPLLEYLIKTYTNPGETVLDPTMGSGSTGVAAVNTVRNFIGVELDAGYFEIARNRIQEAEATH